MDTITLTTHAGRKVTYQSDCMSVGRYSGHGAFGEANIRAATYVANLPRQRARAAGQQELPL